MASSDANDIQSLLRFLTQSARIPLSDALKTIPALRTANLASQETIAKTPLSSLSKIFPDQKLARQVLNAAKRACKAPGGTPSRKRPAQDDNDASSPTQSRSKKPRGDKLPSESSLRSALTPSTLPLSALSQICIKTNRAPLLLAFAYVVLGYTMPEQPPSSRLSLAAGVVAKNSRSKARSLGIGNVGTKGRREGEEEERKMGEGFGKVMVLGRGVEVLRRDTATMEDDEKEERETKVKKEEEEDDEVGKVNAEFKTDTEAQVKAEEEQERDTPLPLWAVDLPTLSSPSPTPTSSSTLSSLPIHPPQPALSYLTRAFTLSTPPSPPIPNTAPLSHLLQALQLLVSSWSNLDPAVLDQRAWGWYVEIRPDVDSGAGGWGQKGIVDLGRVLGLMKPDAGGKGKIEEAQGTEAEGKLKDEVKEEN